MKHQGDSADNPYTDPYKFETIYHQDFHLQIFEIDSTQPTSLF